MIIFQLQEAFAAGLLKPGLNRIYEKSADKKFENDVQGMKQKIAELLGEMGTKIPWIEKLDLVSKNNSTQLLFLIVVSSSIFYLEQRSLSLKLHL